MMGRKACPPKVNQPSGICSAKKFLLGRSASPAGGAVKEAKATYSDRRHWVRVEKVPLVGYPEKAGMEIEPPVDAKAARLPAPALR